MTTQKQYTTLSRSNTKLHWTLLAIARYNDMYNMPARTRDLYHVAGAVIGEGHNIAVSITKLRSGGMLGAVEHKSKGKSGVRDVNAYYITQKGLDKLREKGLPTEYPDGTKVTKKFTFDIPESPTPVEDFDKPDPERDPAYYKQNEKRGKIQTPEPPEVEETPTPVVVRVEEAETNSMFTDTQRKAIEELRDTISDLNDSMEQLEGHPMLSGEEADAVSRSRTAISDLEERYDSKLD